MDLIEQSMLGYRRHPWEVSRAESVVRLLAAENLGERENLRILDVGCGDGFAGRRVREALNARELVGVDANLDEQAAQAMGGPGETFVRDAAKVAGLFDVFLFLDVIEHVEDDVALLRSYLQPHAAKGAWTLVTVPAFQSLFSQHDVTLKHFRRYSMAQLREQLTKAGLTIERDGYWFGSLLPARAVSLLSEKIRPPSSTDSVGIGQWRGGDTLTRLLCAAMSLDNRVLTALSSYGVQVPGLSAWALCRIA
jgi:SAM-dependent methyltransferase